MSPAFEAPQTTAISHRKGRCVLFVGVALVFVWGLLELGGGIAWWVSTGEFFTWNRAALLQACDCQS